ncbi:MAG: S9 family peptidase [Chloroflexota bacterium]
MAPAGHRDTKPTSTIFSVRTDGSTEPIALTDSERNNVSPRWSPDGQTLAFVSDRPNRGDGQLHLLSIEGGEARRITSLKGGVQTICWSMDGERIYLTAQRKALAGTQETDSEIKVASEQPRPRSIAVVSRAGGALRELGPPNGHVWTFALSPDGERIAAMVSPTERLDDAADNSWLIIFSVTSPRDVVPLQRFMGAAEHLAWSPDGTSVVLINSRRPDHLHSHVHIVNARSGDIQTLPDLDMTPTWAGFVRDELFVLNTRNQRSHLSAIDPDTGMRASDISLQVDEKSHWISPQMSATADGALAFLGASSTRPADVFIRHPDGGCRKLSDLNSLLEEVALAEMEEVIWESKDGLEIHGWLLEPPLTDGEGPFPLVVNVHGGPTMAWGDWFHGTWHDWAQVLAARGYAVFLPNPRGSTGKGQAFTGANRADLGGNDYYDVIAGIDRLIDSGVADPERLGIGGWSYGGFLTALSIVRSDRFKAAVAGAAVTNWTSKVGTTDIRPMNERNFPGPLHRSPDPYWIRSPVRYLRNAKTPTLIVHGEADERVPVSQGLELYLGLKAMDVDTEFVTYPRQGHAFHERAFQLDLLNRICDWYDRFLKA